MTISEANNPLAEGLSDLIRERGLNRHFLAEKAGYALEEFDDMLNGRRLIKACDIPCLAYALGIEPDEIFDAGKKAGK